MNVEIIRKLVPVKYQTQVKSLYKFSDCELPDDMLQLDCVICTSMGYLIELKNKISTNCCEISSKEAREIRPLFIYGSTIEIVYIVEFANTQLELVSRSPSKLKSIRIEKDVSIWEISDSLNLGHPQLKVKRQNGMWENIPLQEEKQVVLSEGLQDMLIPLQNTLQKMQMRLQHSKDLLAAKCRIRSQTTAELYPDPSKPEPLLVLSYNYALHHGQIVLVTKFRNTCGGNISKLELVIISKNSIGLRLKQQSSLASLSDSSEACLVGSISTSESLPVLSPAISYYYGGDDNSHHLVPLPSRVFTPHDVLSDEFKVENLDIRAACQVLEHCSGATQHLQIWCSQAHVMENMKFLITKLKNSHLLTLLKEHEEASLWSYSGLPVELHGGYIVLRTKANSVLLCCRDNSQLAILHMIMSCELIKELQLVPFHSQHKFVEKANPQSGLKALECELEWLCLHSRALSKPVPAEEYRNFYEQLVYRSAATDTFFESKH